MDIRSIRHNCRLLYHLTQIPIRCLSPDSSICFTFPHLEGMERFPLPLLPESLPHKNTVPLPVLFMENNAYYSAALPLALTDRNFTLYFGPCLFPGSPTGSLNRAFRISPHCLLTCVFLSCQRCLSWNRNTFTISFPWPAACSSGKKFIPKRFWRQII